MHTQHLISHTPFYTFKSSSFLKVYVATILIFTKVWKVNWWRCSYLVFGTNQVSSVDLVFVFISNYLDMKKHKHRWPFFIFQGGQTKFFVAFHEKLFFTLIVTNCPKILEGVKSHRYDVTQENFDQYVMLLKCFKDFQGT
jgi:hypothetical protein